MQWSNNALDLAQESGDAHLVSYILMRKSNIASDARKPALVVAFGRAALQSPGSLTPRLRAVALRQEAHGYALGGNHDACARALDHACQEAADAPDGDADIALLHAELCRDGGRSLLSRTRQARQGADHASAGSRRLAARLPARPRAVLGATRGRLCRHRTTR